MASGLCLEWRVDESKWRFNDPCRGIGHKVTEYTKQKMEYKLHMGKSGSVKHNTANITQAKPEQVM